MTEEEFREGLENAIRLAYATGSNIERMAGVVLAYLRAHSPEVADILDDEKLVRDSFERWIKAPPFERNVARLGESSAWPGCYKEYEIELAWCAWQDARKGVSARVRYLNGAVQNLGKMVAGQADEGRCLITGNPCGTDTVGVGQPCKCLPCKLVAEDAEVERLKEQVRQVSWDNAASATLVLAHEEHIERLTQQLAEAKAVLVQFCEAGVEDACDEWGGDDSDCPANCPVKVGRRVLGTTLADPT